MGVPDSRSCVEGPKHVARSALSLDIFLAVEDL